MLLSSSTSYENAVAGCEALNEQLWSPESAKGSIQANLDYLVYEGKATEDAQFWIAPLGSGRRAITALGEVGAVNSTLGLPALCTQSAPLATTSKTDNSSGWQISVRSNNDDLVGCVRIPLV